MLWRLLDEEFFRVMLKYDLDFYEVVHKARVLHSAYSASPFLLSFFAACRFFIFGLVWVSRGRKTVSIYACA